MTAPLDPAPYVLLHLIRCADCRAPMTPTMRAEVRVYRCTGTCGREIDALHAETLMWDRVAKRHPQQVRPNMSAEQRREVLAAVLTLVHARGPSYLLSLRADWAERRPAHR